MENIILIGMSLSGKSTLGNRLAKKIGYKFIDTDKEIEKKEGITIREIFKLKGEEYFRNLEKELVNNLCKDSKIVISTGGGMPIYNNNMKSLRKKGKIIYLKAPLDMLIQRGENARNRPLLIGNYKKEIEIQYEKRKEIYNNADVIIEVNSNIEDNLNKLLMELNF